MICSSYGRPAPASRLALTYSSINFVDSEGPFPIAAFHDADMNRAVRTGS
ncbi:hypothetical protein [uncultured Megasphaera sp.]|nr:hypothetical protein [uncultured Megasphaera sp.]